MDYTEPFTMNFEKEHVRSILIIDDDQDDYELVHEAIQEINPLIRVEYASGCNQLLRYRQKNFDLILLDINMPHHDGFFILNSIRSHGYGELPIIMYTNSVSPSHIEKAYVEGANLYFVKPESFSTLLKSLRKLVSMDWAKPFQVTETYGRNGSYKVFQAD